MNAWPLRTSTVAMSSGVCIGDVRWGYPRSYVVGTFKGLAVGLSPCRYLMSRGIPVNAKLRIRRRSIYVTVGVRRLAYIHSRRLRIEQNRRTLYLNLTEVEHKRQNAVSLFAPAWYVSNSEELVFVLPLFRSNSTTKMQDFEEVEERDGEFLDLPHQSR